MSCRKVFLLSVPIVIFLFTVCYHVAPVISTASFIQIVDASTLLANDSSLSTNTSTASNVISTVTQMNSQYDPGAGLLQFRYTGLIRSDISPDVAEQLGLNDTNPGVMVIEVIPGSPADMAGIRAANMTRAVDGEIVRLGGDIIVAVDGNASVAKDDDAFVDYLQNEKLIGDNVTLTFLRDGKVDEVEMTLGSLPDFFWYIDDDEGIRMQYPSDWRVSDTNLGRNDVIKFFSPEENTDLGVATAAVLVKVAPAGEITLDEVAAQEMEGASKTRALDIGGTELSGLQAYESIFYEYGANRTLKVMSTFTINDDQLYRINYAADTSKYDDYLPAIEEMLRSFEFTK
jgi:hypothetical protein